MFNRPWTIASGALLLLLLVGCFPTIQTHISAYARADAAQLKHFRLVGPDPANLGGDPRWPTFARMMTKALEEKGFVADPVSPDLVILVSYRVGDTQTYTTSETTTDANGAVSTSTSSSEASLYSIRVEAVDPQSWAAKKPVVLWSTHATLRESSDDMAKFFPYMVASMEEYFAQAAEGVTVIKERDDSRAKGLQAK